MAISRMSRLYRHETGSWIVVAALAGLLAGLVVGPALAQSPTPPPSGADGVVEHRLTVGGLGTVFVTPDEADLTVGVQRTRDTVTLARDDAAQAMAAVIDALRVLGIAEADIRTSMLSISPVYDYTGERDQQRIVGYQVTNIVSVRVRDLTKLAAAIDDSVAAGATTVGGVTFRIADPSAAESEARQAAVADARQRADTLAAAAGVRIVGVASISETFSAPWSGGDNRGEAPTPVLPGTSEVSVSVVIAYLIE